MIVEPLEPEEIEKIKENIVNNKSSKNIEFKFEEDKEAAAKKETIEEVFTNEHEAKNFIKQAMTYVKSESFSNKCDELAEKHNVSKKKIAKTFFQKVLGQIGDKSTLAFDTFETGVMIFINIVGFIIKKGIDIICTLARILFKALTFNYTVKAPQV